MFIFFGNSQNNLWYYDYAEFLAMLAIIPVYTSNASCEQYTHGLKMIILFIKIVLNVLKHDFESNFSCIWLLMDQL
jgi:hypothetical protein